MSRRTAGFVALGLAAVLALFAALQPVDYVTLKPGPTVNVLGDYQGEKVIQISGRRTYEDGGELRMLTVYQSRPEQNMDLLTAFSGWVSSSTAVLPKSVIYKEQDTNASVQQESALQMATSQDDATVVALRAAGIAYKTIVRVGAVTPGGASDGVLKVGDQLVKVNGKTVTEPESVSSLIRPLAPGSKVTVQFRRKGKLRTVTLKTKATEVPVQAPSPAEAACPSGAPIPVETQTVSLIGITPAPKYVYPFKIDITVGDSIGGPSAGMMFALSIYDLLTPGSLTGGEAIAGSGTIDGNGVVGAIGGIGQKMLGAQRAGAKLFLVASENWSEAINSTYDKSKMKLVRVHTADQALKAINTWRENPDAHLPGCAA